jgi:O-succinylhomoserine sulfhydrylase
MRSAGMSLSPFNAWVVLKGLETLRMRMQAQSAARAGAGALARGAPGVERVYHPGLPRTRSTRWRWRSRRAGRRGAVVRREGRPRRGGRRAFAVIDATRICSIAANLGDTKTIITHPASTSHGRLTEAQRQAAGIGQGMIRLAVGLEDVDDLRPTCSAALR